MTGYAIVDISGTRGKKFLRELPLIKLSTPFRRFINDRDDNRLSETLKKARVNATSYEFKAWVVEWTFLFSIISLIGAVAGFLITRFYIVFMILLTPLIFYFIADKLPFSWKRSLEKQFSGLSYITFLSLFNVFISSGMRLDEAFERVGDIGIGGGFNAIALECKRIVTDVRSFGMDIMGALQESAKYSPSEKWAGFVGGIVSSAKSGSNIVTYINDETTRALFDWDKEIEKMTESLNIFSEVYVTVGNAFPLFLIFMVGILSAMGAEGSAGPSETLLLALLIPPVLVGIFVWLFASSVKEGFK
ncbi:MAG: type II secretion system F family protein [Candidatus Parvarchaeota archaeon]